MYIEVEEKEEPTVYRSGQTYVYQETRGAKRLEEYRIYIYTTTPDVTDSDLDAQMTNFFEEKGFTVPLSKVKGDELNNEVDDMPPNKKTDIYYMTFSLDDQKKFEEEARR